MFTHRALFLALAVLACVHVCSAATVVSQTGTFGDIDDRTAYFSWTQTGTFTGVTIQMTLADLSSNSTGTAYLTTQIGSVTTPLATTPIASVPSGAGTAITLFSGLTLGPGTYYVTFSRSGGAGDLGYPVGGGSPTQATGSGVTFGPIGVTNSPAGFPPASTFAPFFGSEFFGFSVTGTAAAPSAPTGVPALSGLGLMTLAGMLMLAGFFMLRRRMV
jgi:hypothetical protein